MNHQPLIESEANRKTSLGFSLRRSMFLLGVLASVACGEPTDAPFSELGTGCAPGLICIDPTEQAETSEPTNERIGVNLDLAELNPTTQRDDYDIALNQIKPVLNFEAFDPDSANVCSLYENHSDPTILSTLEGQNTMLTDAWRDSSKGLIGKRSIWISNMSAGWMNFIDFHGDIVDDTHIDVSTYVKMPDPTTEESVWYCSVTGSTALLSDQHIELNARNLNRMGGCSDAVAVEGSIRIPSDFSARFDARRVVFRDLDEEIIGLSNFSYDAAGMGQGSNEHTRHFSVDFGTWDGQQGAVVMEMPTGGVYRTYVKMPGSDIIFCVGAIGSEDGFIILNELAQLPSCESATEVDGELDLCTGR